MEGLCTASCYQIIATMLRSNSIHYRMGRPNSFLENHRRLPKITGHETRWNSVHCKSQLAFLQGSSRPLHKAGPGKAGQGLTSNDDSQDIDLFFTENAPLRKNGCNSNPTLPPGKERNHTVFAFDMPHSSTWILANLIELYNNLIVRRKSLLIFASLPATN
jgi:hypothetical protein